ncbi:MAG: OmpA family protein [Bacteroidetes bacterium]|nr:OmpA family protein [Bacteroidota bacterium]
MRVSIIYLFLLIPIFWLNMLSAQKFSGTWQGIFEEDSTLNTKHHNAIYFKFNVISGLVDAKCKIEPYQQEYYGTYTLNGNVDVDDINLNFSKKIIELGVNLGEFSFRLNYSPRDGYLRGQLYKKGQSTSTSRIVLYKQEMEWKDTHQKSSHLWVDRLKKDLLNGVSSPTIRKEELKAFTFQPVYFDYDQYVIKDEFKSYLSEIVKMLNSHSDLRLRITGHTDGDGSNAYNLTLSKNRAKSLIDFFIVCGIEKSRIVIDFKGENYPVDRNDTQEGKQRNRRVNFEFI